MPTTSVDFASLRKQAKLQEIPPPGSYESTCMTTKVQPTKKGDKQLIKARYRITKGPEKGKTIWDNHVLSPESNSALYFFFDAIEAHGLNLDHFDPKDLTPVAARMVGAAVKITMEHGEYNGRPTINVLKYEPGLSAKKPAPPKKPTASTKSSSAGSPPPPPSTLRK